MASVNRRKRVPVTSVQIDGLVVLKIIKHCQEEGSTGNELVQGVLLGLVENGKLEVTHSFPFPERGAEDDDFYEVNYQLEMMKNLRKVNVDHLHVGWYQSTFMGTYLNKALLDNQFSYQHSIDESIVLVYDPLKTAKGLLSFKAIRLTPAMMQLYRENEHSYEMIKSSGVNSESIFEEVPVVITNSHLVNSLFCEVEEVLPQDKHAFLDLSSSSFLEKNLRLLIDCVDDLTQDNNKFFNYQRQMAKVNNSRTQHMSKRQQENKQRQDRGEEPLPDEDITKIFKAPTMPSRLDPMLLAAQIGVFTNQLAETSCQKLGKLSVFDTVHSSLNE